MNRINKILYSEKFKQYCKRNKTAEANRSFCRHDIDHFLSVARIAVIINLQENLQINEEYIYAAALLHDIGRYEQYETGIPHEISSTILAEPILEETGFQKEERNIILESIRNHRSSEVALSKTLSDVIYRADKMSRNCFVCEREKDCDWKADKKNMFLKW